MGPRKELKVVASFLKKGKSLKEERNFYILKHTCAGSYQAIFQDFDGKREKSAGISFLPETELN